MFTVIGDGEANEGSVWEAILVAVDRNLDNLTIVYDDNRSHSRGLQIQNPEEHFRGFGCDVTVVDGHDTDELMSACSQSGNGVKVIVARTVKGYGSAILSANHYEWHRRSPNEEEFVLLMGEINEKAI